MADFAVRAVGLGKQYRVGQLTSGYDTLRDELARLGERLVGRAAPRAPRELFWAVEDATFDIGQGQVVGIVGRNGAGKTTLLRMLSRITEPTAGYADVRGRLGSLLEVGTGFHPELTGRENIFLNGAVLGMRRRETAAKFDEIVEFAGVEKFVDTPVKRYSSGMYVRLAFSVAAHLEPDILVVDEVLAVGDAEFQRRSIGKMDEIGTSGRTVIFVSHNMQTITRLCTRALLLDGGRVVDDGPTEAVVARYLRIGAGLSSASEEWPDRTTAPGDGSVFLRSIRAVDEHGETVETIDVRRPLGIELVLDVEEPVGFVPWLALYNEHGAHVFSALDPDPAWLAGRDPGRYTTTARIPENLLNEGTIIVSVALNSFAPGGSLRRAQAHQVISFQVVDPGLGDTARGMYPGIWTAPVRPLLRWDTKVEHGAKQ